jgi:hypothetical protein
MGTDATPEGQQNYEENNRHYKKQKTHPDASKTTTLYRFFQRVPHTSSISTQSSQQAFSSQSITTNILPPSSSFITPSNAVDNYESFAKLRQLSFGHKLSVEAPLNHLTIAYFNVNRIPISRMAHKSQQMIDHLAHYKVDIALIAETGINPTYVPAQDSWYERTRDRLPNTYSFSKNKHEPNKHPSLWGGTLTIAAGKARARVHGKGGQDNSGLGRWSWLLLQGRHGYFTRFITVYRPCKTKDNLGSAYNQHLRYWRDKGNFECPLIIFDQDLEQQLQEWLQAGEQLIIGIDANEDIRQGQIHTMMDRLGLRDSILSMFPHQTPPETNLKNNHRCPIDAIFTTPGIHPTTGGYTPYFQLAFSDHRGMFITVPYDSCLGHNLPDIPPPPIRRIKAKDPASRNLYCKLLTQSIEKSKLDIFGNAFLLSTMQTSNTPRTMIIDLHSKIMQSCLDLRLKAAKKTRHVFTGTYEWSPEWRQHESAVRLWRVASRRWKQRIRGRYLKRLMKAAGNQDCLLLSESQTLQRLEEASQAQDAFKPIAPQKRQDFLLALANRLAVANKTNADSELRALTHQSKQRETARKLRQISKRARKGLALKLEIGPEHSPQIIEDKESLERISAQVNIDRYTQCLTVSEFITDPELFGRIGVLAEGDGVPGFLTGTEPIPRHLSKYTQLVLHHIRTPPQYSPMPLPCISAEDHVKGWRSARESTTSEPSLPDFSHYIAATFDTRIVEMDRTLRELPLLLGFAPTEWNPMTTCSIPKKANNMRAEDQRSITLLEAQFNQNNKWYGRQFMHHNEARGTIPKEQTGSRKGHSAAITALNKVLAMDILRQQRQAGFLCSNDASQCYDRILHNVAMMSMLRLGAHINALTSLFGQLQKGIHRTMTGYGISNSYHGGEFRTQTGVLPYQGVLQGNGMGPVIWLAISVLLINIMEHEGHAAIFISAISLTTLKLCCFMFVDDCDLLNTATGVDTSAVSSLLKFQQAIDCWEGCLRVTGGALKPSKSFWYLIDWKWENNHWRYANEAETPGTITVLDNGQRIALRRYEPSQSNMTLGIHLAMDGNQKGEISHLRKEAVDFADRY